MKNYRRKNQVKKGLMTWVEASAGLINATWKDAKTMPGGRQIML
jgi:hypothetical protein